MLHNPKYSTTVDTINGVKQAFALNVSDVSLGNQIGATGGTTTSSLTPETITWMQKLDEKNGDIDYAWLRSPNRSLYEAGTIYVESSVNSPCPLGCRVNATASTVPALVVHIEDNNTQN